ncbi:MAG: ribosome maturation factor RimP [Bacteroidota bacterium]
MEAHRIKEIVESILEEENLFLIEILIKGKIGNKKVLVFIDGDDGISIDQCSKVSRKLSAEIEAQDLIQGKYTLEVSSPGLDFPLILSRQYRKNVGRGLKVELMNGEKIEGKLIKVDEGKISLKTGVGEKFFLYNEIKQSKVKISFK